MLSEFLDKNAFMVTCKAIKTACFLLAVHVIYKTREKFEKRDLVVVKTELNSTLKWVPYIIYGLYCINLFFRILKFWLISFIFQVVDVSYLIILIN